MITINKLNSLYTKINDLANEMDILVFELGVKQDEVENKAYTRSSGKTTPKEAVLLDKIDSLRYELKENYMEYLEQAKESLEKAMDILEGEQ